MRRPSRSLLAAGAGLAALALGLAAARARPRAEQAIQSRLESEAARRGLRARIAAARLGLWPPLVLRNVRLEKPGAWTATTPVVEVWPRLAARFLSRVRLELGSLRLEGPGGLSAAVKPTAWDVGRREGGLDAELRAPAGGLSLAWSQTGEAASRLDVRATGVPVGRLLEVRREGVPLLDPGIVIGRIELTRGLEATRIDLDLSGRLVRLGALSGDAAADTAPVFGQPTEVALRLLGSWRPAEGTLALPRWEARIDGAALSGSLTVDGVGGDPSLDLSLDVQRVDFARLFRTSGLVRPQVVALPMGDAGGRDDLGSASLSAHAEGRLADPDSFTMTQRLDFAPPARLPAALTRLRGDFTDEVVLPDGSTRTIEVSPSSPDFIPIAEVPALLLRTLLIAEDAGFWGHRGIDLSELPSALLTNWARGRPARGASTITQQLAKNLFLSREKRLGRKLQELSLALLLEAALSKQRILEIYLNVIEWGPGLYGLRPAARRYFGVEPGALTPAQTAFLVALIPGPVKYQRSFADGTVSRGFRPLVDELLAKLRSVDALSEEQYQAALAEELVVQTSPPEPVPGEGAAGAGGAR